MSPKSSHRHAAALAAMFIGILVLSSCTKPTDVASTWHGSPGTNSTYNRILVVGVSENSNRRRAFEDYVVNGLRKRGNQARASSRILDIHTPLDRESISGAAATAEADAILVTRLISRKVTAQEVEARTGVKTQRKQDTVVDFFRYDYEEYEEPAYVIPKNTVVLATDFYPAGKDNPLYSLKTTTYDKETIYDIIEEVSDVIVARLAREGLIQ